VSEMGDAPLARSSDLIIEELGDEVLVYDTKADRGHSLSPEAAKIWNNCNGRTTAEMLSAQLGLDPETVDRALDELTTCELLEVRPMIVADGSTRREVTMKLAKVGAAAAVAPLILSVAAPSAHAAATLAFCNQFSSGNCGGNTGCSKTVGCCCCTPPLHSPYPAGSPCAENETGTQCKTCVPCPGTVCPQFGQVQCSAGDC
jgi:hypothetical protein